MKKPSEDWTDLREQILGFGDRSSRKTYYPALRKRIAELERIGTRLRESDARLKLALQAAELSMWDWDVTCNRLNSDERWAGMLGLDPAERTRRIDDWAQRVHPEDLEADRAAFFALFRGDSDEFTREHRLRHADGHWVWVLTTGKVLERDENGRPLRAYGTHLDITRLRRAEQERRDLEAQVQHAQKLESLGVLAGGIAHDFNNLLVAILGNADLARMDVPPESPIRLCLDEICTAAQRASELTNQMLAYSGKGRFEVRAVDLNDLVREMARLLEVSISKKAVLDYDFAPDLPSVEIDPVQIRQVVMNLVTNAADALGGDDGTIRVASRLIEAERADLAATYLDEKLPPGNYVALEVSDTGCGMDDATRERLFDPFFTTKSAGRGLGMAAVLGIVRGHQGAISVQSEPGRGTTFRILLPAGDQTAPDETPAERTHRLSVRRNERILVVDDEESVRHLAARMLETNGFQVLSARDGVEAVRLFQTLPNTIDLVLLDATMPRMDGAETFRRIREIRADVPVILSSGYSQQDPGRDPGAEEPDGFIQKPYTRDDLLNMVVRLLDG